MNTDGTLDLTLNAPITNKDYRALREGAEDVGDDVVVQLCNDAIDGDYVAQKKCDAMILTNRENGFAPVA